MSEKYLRSFQMPDTVCGNDLPELMNSTGLSAAYSRLASGMQKELELLLQDNETVTGILEKLAGQNERWYTRAVLMSLGSGFKTLDSSSRDICLSYLFDMMFSGSRSIKSEAAQAAGRLIAEACNDDMSVWTDFLHRALFIKTEESPFSKGLAEDPLRIVLLTVYNKAAEDRRRSVLNSYASYFKSARWDSWTCLRLISGIFTIPYREWGAMQRGYIGGFIRYFLKTDDPEVRVASLCLLKEWLDQGWRPSDDFHGFLSQALTDICEGSQAAPAEIFLISEVAGLSDMTVPSQETRIPHDSVLFQENLRSNHSWLFKLVNLRILKDKYRNEDPETSGFALYASHLLTILRLNPNEMVFDRAGEDLLDIAPKLSQQQKYEIFKELFKVIETGYDETGYLPRFLGRLFCRVSNETRRELIADIQELSGRRDPRTVAETLEAVCFIADMLSKEAPDDRDARYILEKMCGLLSQGMYSDLAGLPAHILFTAGSVLFEEQGDDESFADLARNILICMKKDMKPDLLCHTDACRIIAGWLSHYSENHDRNRRPVAFYQGSFDPFTNGHHAIVSEIADMGFQVYVNVHDFAWNRNVQPLLLRRQMAAMSVMDLAHVQLFPEEITVNMENASDLGALKELFPDREIWIVAGNDRVESDPIYTGKPAEESVHYFPHIVFTRSESSGYYDEEELTKNLRGDVTALRIPVYYEHMTSWEVRNNIQEGKSIDGLVSPQVANLIRRLGLYGGSRLFKQDIPQLAVDTECTDDGCSIYLRENDGREFCGRIAIEEKNDPEEGRCAVFAGAEYGVRDDLSAVLLDETLMSLQCSGYDLARCGDGLFPEELLKARGFLEDDRGWTVSMRRPIVLFTDIYSCFSDNFDGDERLRRVCAENAERLMTAAAGLFPGTLVLNVSTEIMNYRLGSMIRRRCSENGERICVPFGKILKTVNIPGVIMMPLDTEKLYDPDMRSFNVCEKEGYPVLQTQLRTIRSMDRPFVLVDDLYHRGYRIQKISDALSQEGMKEDGVIVGVLSGRGEQTAAAGGHSVEAAYSVPDMRLWIIESDMLPFFGSDRLDTDTGSRPSVYPILPYQFPSFLKETEYTALYDLSYVCIDNAIRLFETLESLYREKYGRVMTFSRIQDVIEDAGLPEFTIGNANAGETEVSELLKGELVRLKRMDPRR